MELDANLKHDLRKSFTELSNEHSWAVYRDEKDYWLEVIKIKEELNIPDYQ
jgi:hypothetical protein